MEVDGSDGASSRLIEEMQQLRRDVHQNGLKMERLLDALVDRTEKVTDAAFSARELAKKHGVAEPRHEALRKRLERYAKRHPESRVAVVIDGRVLYIESAVVHIVRRMPGVD